MRTNKREYQQHYMLNSPIDIIHGIKEEGGAISWIHQYTISPYMPIFVQRVMLVDVPPPRCQPMVTLPHVEHVANKVSKVRVFFENGIKLCIGLLP